MGRVMGHVMKNLSGSSKNGGLSAMAVGMAGIDGVMTYSSRQRENPEESKAFSAAMGVGTAAAWALAEPLMWGITLAQGATWAGKEFIDETRQNRLEKSYNANKVTNEHGTNVGTLGGKFQDSEQAATMRQRQADLLRQHRIATETILGSEARQLHR